jgi:hypothetical protein
MVAIAAAAREKQSGDLKEEKTEKNADTRVLFHDRMPSAGS